MRRWIAVLIVVTVICLPIAASLPFRVATTHGATPVWEKAPLDAGDVNAIMVHPSEPGTVFAGTDQGLFRSMDRGGTWGPYGTGIKTKSSSTVTVLSLAASRDVGRMYAGTSAGVFQSTDGGATWSQGSGMLSGSGIIRYYYAIATLALDPVDPRIVYAGDTGMMTEGRVLKSTDGGGTWTSTGTGMSGHNVTSLAVDPDNASTVYAVVEDSLYVSVDAGLSWTPTTGTMKVGSSDADALAVAVTSDALFAGTTAGVWKSTDGGATWSQGTGLSSSGYFKYYFGIAALTVDPAKPSVLYAGDSGLMTSGGVSVSTNGGSDWTQVGGALTENISALGVDSSEPTMIYAGTNTGLFRLVNVPVVRFRITASAPQGNGTILPPMQEITEGGTVTLNLLPDAGYRLTRLTDNTSNVTGLVRNNSYELASVTADHVVVATFEPIPIVPPPLPSHRLALTIGSLVMTADGRSVMLDSSPIIREGRTLLPIRAVIEALEGTVTWDAVQRKATVTLGVHTVEVWIGSKNARVDGINVALDVAAIIVNSRTLLPLRFVAENLGCTVTWDAVSRTVTIES
jgi:photosystem II stability/assembly factor-like uncharacterized protein